MVDVTARFTAILRIGVGLTVTRELDSWALYIVVLSEIASGVLDGTVACVVLDETALVDGLEAGVLIAVL